MTPTDIAHWLEAWTSAVASGHVRALDRLVSTPLQREVLARARAVHEAFEHIEVVALDAVADGDRIAWRWRLSGVHTRVFAGVAPSRERRTIDGVNFQRVVDGVAVEHYTLADIAAFQRG